MKLEITADWVLSNLTGTASGSLDDIPGKATICTYNEIAYHFITLALNQMGVEFELGEFEDGDGTMTDTFDFNFEAIKNECPEFYEKYKRYVYQNKSKH